MTPHDVQTDSSHRRGNLRAQQDYPTTRRAARRMGVVAGFIFVVGASWPFDVMGQQCAPLTCDTSMAAAIESGSEMDCFAFTAADGEFVDISVVSQADGGSFLPAWSLLDD